MLKQFKATTPSLRFVKQINYPSFFLNKLKIKNQSKHLTRRYGRNNQGQVTSFHKGGGCARIYRVLYTYPFNTALVLGLEYDPFRTAFLMRLLNLDTYQLIYQVAPNDVNRGDLIRCQKHTFGYHIGHSAPLSLLPYGAHICNIQISQQSKKSFSSSAGTYSQIIQKDTKYCLIKLSSGEIRYVFSNSLAMFGRISNGEHRLICIGKAGRNRWLNRRPIVRGVAMNPIDHPHGGGQGKTAAGRPSVSPWGQLTKGGVKTSTNFKRHSLIYQKRILAKNTK